LPEEEGMLIDGIRLLPKLKRLVLHLTFSDALAIKLAQLPKLEILVIRRVNIDLEDIPYLSADAVTSLAYMKSLRSLHIIGEQSKIEMIKAPHLDQFCVCKDLSDWPYRAEMTREFFEGF
jgi:hypothetical protein